MSASRRAVPGQVRVICEIPVGSAKVPCGRVAATFTFKPDDIIRTDAPWVWRVGNERRFGTHCSRASRHGRAYMLVVTEAELREALRLGKHAVAISAGAPFAGSRIVRRGRRGRVLDSRSSSPNLHALD